MIEFVAMLLGMVTGSLVAVVITVSLQPELECVQGVIVEGKAMCAAYVDKKLAP